MSRLILAGALASLAAILPAQQILTVDPAGSTPYRTINQAVAAASSGDTVRVLAGTYRESLDIDKGIRIIGYNAVLVGQALGFYVVTIRNIPAGQTAAISGFFAQDLGGRSSIDVGLRVANCRGLVAVSNLRQQGLRMFAIRVENSEQTHFSNMVLRGAIVDSADTVFGGCVFDPTLGSALKITNGKAVCVRCGLSGGTGVFRGPGIWMINSEVAVSQSSIRGSFGGPIVQPAVLSSGGKLLLDPSTTLSTPGVQGSALVVTRTFASQTVHDDGATLTAQINGAVGASFGLFVSEPVDVLTSFGDAWVDPSRFGVLTVGVFPSGGSLQKRFAHAPIPLGAAFAIQTVAWDSAKLTLGTPSVIVAR